MAGGVVNVVIAKQAIDEVTRLKTELGLSVQELIKLSAEGAKFGIKANSSTEVSKLKSEIDKLTIALKGVDQVEKNQKQNTLALEKARARLTNIYTKEAQELLKVRTNTNTLVAEQRKAVKFAQLAEGTYAKLTARYRQLETAAQNAGAKFGVNSKQFKNASAAALQYRNRIDGVDKALRNNQRNVGNYGSALAKTSRVLTSFVGALGLASGAFAFVRVMREGIKVAIDFEKANATLSGILQIEAENMVALKDNAKALGETTVRTASEVTQLQIAYARLGFSQQDILDLSEATIEGSIALNAELDRTANLTGAVVNSFDDFSASDAPQIMDVLSLSTAKSALNFEKLEAGIPIVAGAANAARIPFTTLIALMGKLSDAGIDVSSSSTAIRNIFIEAAGQGLSYGEILDKIKDSSDKLTTAYDEFGKRAAVSGTVLASNIEATKDLDVALQGAQGTAKAMAEKELDTLAGSLDLLKSAWQGIILETDDANNITKQLKDQIKLLAENLRPIVDTIVKVVKAFVLYKAIILAVNLAGRLFVAGQAAMRIASIAMQGGLVKATRAMKLFNITTKANPLGILVTLIAAAVAGFVAFREGALSAAGAQKKLNDEIERGRESSEGNRNEALERITAETELIRERGRARIAETDDEKEIAEIKKDIHNETLELLQKEQEAAKQRTIQFSQQLTTYKEGTPIYERYKEQLKVEAETYDILGRKIKSLITDKKELDKTNKELSEDGDGEGPRDRVKNIVTSVSTDFDEVESQLSINALKEQIKVTQELINLSNDDSERIRLMKINEELQKQLHLLQAGERTTVSQVAINSEMERYLSIIKTTAEVEAKKDADKLKRTEELGEKLQLINEFQNLAADLGIAITERRITKLEEEKDAVDEAAEQQIEAAEKEAISEEEKEEKIRLIEEERDRKQKILDKKIAREKTKQAQIDKAASLANVAINTAVAVSKVWGQTGIFGIAAQIPVLVMGALQAAVIAATPIPKFAKGTKGKLAKDTIGLTGDGGKHEAVTKDGKLLGITPKTDTITFLPKGSEVHPDAENWISKLGQKDYTKVLERSSILTTMQQGIYGGDAKKQFEINYGAMGASFEAAFNRSLKNMPRGISKQQTKEAFEEALSNSDFIKNGLM